MVYRNSRLYEGDWENDLKHGKGFEIFQNASFYTGFYANGKPEGKFFISLKVLDIFNGPMARFMRVSG